MREKTTDALLSAAIKSIEELEGLVVMLENIGLPSKLRELADLLDTLPKFAGDLSVVKRRLRGMMSTDPDKTPRAISVKDLAAVPIGAQTLDVEGKRFEPVEERERRTTTFRGLGVGAPPGPATVPRPSLPVPKKDKP